jgi:hypothetical protein
MAGPAETYLTPRLRRRVQRDFPFEFQDVERVLDGLTTSEGVDPERLAAAILLGADGDLVRLVELMEISKHRPAEALRAGELSGSDLAARLDTLLGPGDASRSTLPGSGPSP